MDPKNPGLLAYVHPAVATVGLVMCFLALRQGLKQRDQRVKRIPAPPGTLKRHVSLGPWAVGLMVLSAGLGVLTAVVVRGWKPLDTGHGWVSLAGTLLFVLIWWLGRRLLRQQKHLANRHGLLGVLAMFLAGIGAILGIELLP